MIKSSHKRNTKHITCTKRSLLLDYITAKNVAGKDNIIHSVLISKKKDILSRVGLGDT